MVLLYQTPSAYWKVGLVKGMTEHLTVFFYASDKLKSIFFIT